MRIGIVNDLSMAVEALRRVLAAAGHQVAWVAHDGAGAVAQCAADTPDLVLMDLVMPGMDGVEATRLFMSRNPCPILIVTVSVGANASRVYEAMGHGALDAVDTPALGTGSHREGAALLLAKIDAIDKLVGDGAGAGLVVPPASAAIPARAGRLVAIGASAGGPAALATVLGGLPADFPAAIVIVQHVDQRFARGMAEWLDQQTALTVRVAREGDQPTLGSALLAATDDHLHLKNASRVGYTPEPQDYVYRPSVDVFFHSVCRHWSGEVIGVLLTGMGRDGALGLKALRDGGHHTIAQDQASSAVYGMPKAAAALGAAVEVLPLAQIAGRLSGRFARRMQ